MSFRLREGEGISANFVRLVGGQVESALSHLGASGRMADADVHDARKSIKRARATLRLFRSAIPCATFVRINVALRDAARPLTHVRDARVIFDTLENVREYFGEAADCIPTDALERKLRTQRAHTRREAGGSSKALATTRRLLRQVAGELEHARVRDEGWNTLGPAIRRVYRSGRTSMQEAGAERTDEKLHEWRKRVKHLWHAMQILEPLRPALLGELADQSHKLADLLGDDHDLAILNVRVLEEGGVGRNAAQALTALIVMRRQALQERAFALGERLFLDKPKQFELRLEKYWARWQREGSQSAVAELAT